LSPGELKERKDGKIVYFQFKVYYPKVENSGIDFFQHTRTIRQ